MCKTPNAGPILVPAARPPLTPEQLARRRAAVADCHRRGGPTCRWWQARAEDGL